MFFLGVFLAEKAEIRLFVHYVSCFSIMTDIWRDLANILHSFPIKTSKLTWKYGKNALSRCWLYSLFICFTWSFLPLQICLYFAFKKIVSGFAEMVINFAACLWQECHQIDYFVKWQLVYLLCQFALKTKLRTNRKPFSLFIVYNKQ